jgi:hypothetical protein
MFLWLVVSDVRRLLSDAAIGENYGDFHAVAIVGELTLGAQCRTGGVFVEFTGSACGGRLSAWRVKQGGFYMNTLLICIGETGCRRN